MNFNFNEFKHLIDNSTSTDKPFNRTQRYPNANDKNKMKILSITTRKIQSKQAPAVNSINLKKKTSSCKSEDKNRLHKYSLNDSINSIHKNRPIIANSKLGTKSSLKYYKVSKSKLTFKKTPNIKITKKAEVNTTYSDSTSYITTTNKEDSMKSNTKNLLFNKQLSAIKLRCKKVLENYSSITQSLLSNNN